MKRIWQELLTLDIECKSFFALDLEPPKLDGTRETGLDSIQGRIFPRSYLYCQHSFRIRLDFPLFYPLAPPRLRLLDRIFHPNISARGEICMPVLVDSERYTPRLSLAFVVRSVEHLLCYPNLDTNYVLNADAARMYRQNPIEFEQTVRWNAIKYGQPLK